MDRDQQERRQHYHPRQSDLNPRNELNNQPTIARQGGQCNQAPPAQHGDPGLTVANAQSDPFAIQSPVFTSASQQASVEEAHLPQNMYAIQTSVEPVSRESNDDFEFFDYLNQVFSEGNEAPHCQANSNVNFLLDPLAWLPKESSPPEKSVALAVMEPRVLAPQMGQRSTPVSACQSSSTKTSKPKAPPIKAAGKIKAAVGGSKHRRQAKASSSQLDPFEFLKNMLSTRGYSFATIKSLEAGYMIDPSPLQLASFGTDLVNAVHTSDVTRLSSLLGSGISPNPCNQFRDSVMDWACRKANDAVFRCFLDHHADVRVCDSFGRTPLHQAAWADTFSPAISIAILQIDPVQLFLEDNNGRTPLEYVPAKQATNWIAFLDNHKEEMFPINGRPLAVTKRQFMQLPDPPNALSVDLARLVSSGQLQPEQIAAMDELTRKTWTMPE